MCVCVIVCVGLCVDFVVVVLGRDLNEERRIVTAGRLGA